MLLQFQCISAVSLAGADLCEGSAEQLVYHRKYWREGGPRISHSSALGPSSTPPATSPGTILQLYKNKIVVVWNKIIPSYENFK